MTPDDLDTKSLEELDRIFAIEVLHWAERDSSFEEFQWEMPDGERAGLEPWSSSADAVLPWLEKQPAKIVRGPISWTVELPVRYAGPGIPACVEGEFAHATAPTFPHAAVKALIRAERAKKGNL